MKKLEMKIQSSQENENAREDIERGEGERERDNARVFQRGKWKRKRDNATNGRQSSRDKYEQRLN